MTASIVEISLLSAIHRTTFGLAAGLSVLLFAGVALGQETGAMAEPGGQALPAPEPPPNSVGGHVGIATPLITIGDETTTIADQFTLLHPIGVSVKVSDNLVIDFETVVANPIDPVGDTGLVVDPGVVYNWGPVATGLRAAWQIGALANFGLIPLVNKGLVDLGGATWFIEAAFPTFYSDHDVTFNAVLHTGVGF